MFIRVNFTYCTKAIPAEVVRLVGAILPTVALFQVFDANAAVTGGILRARGKQVRFPFLSLLKFGLYSFEFTGALLNVR